MWRSYLKALLAIAAGGLIFVGSGAALAQGSSGATLQAVKTIDICDNGDGTWTYSGQIAVWNIGVNTANGLNITDCLQYKTATQSGQPQNIPGACLFDVQGGITTIPGLTQEVDATVFDYSFVGVYNTPLDLTGTIRNSAVLTIVNHSGNRVNGPNPKATWTGGAPPACVLGQTCSGGCTLTLGYWKNHAAWPVEDPQTSPLPGDFFFNSGLTYQQVLDQNDSGGGNAYIKLAHQYIPAVLNVANGACEPNSVAQLIAAAALYFSTQPLGVSSCAASVCGIQVDEAALLDDYNNGLTGPGHCAP